MNIKIEVNCYNINKTQDYGLTLDIYAKTDAKAKELAKKFIDTIPEEK